MQSVDEENIERSDRKGYGDMIRCRFLNGNHFLQPPLKGLLRRSLVAGHTLADFATQREWSGAELSYLCPAINVLP